MFYPTLVEKNKSVETYIYDVIIILMVLFSQIEKHGGKMVILGVNGTSDSYLRSFKLSIMNETIEKKVELDLSIYLDFHLYCSYWI